MRFLLLCLTGCFWIGPAKHGEELDPDGDQVPYPEDCAPNDPAVQAASLQFADADGDGFGDAEVTFTACGPQPGFVDNGDDCDDNAAAVHPGAAEVCDGLGIDEDCDGLLDGDDPDVTGLNTYYTDADADGYGSTPVQACTRPEGASVVAGDCDDTNAEISPDAVEVCGGVDEDCDGVQDDLDPDVTGTSLFYIDGDEDGFGDPASAVARCATTAGVVENSDDCDDLDADIHPNAIEACDPEQRDEDCDGEQNESGQTIVYYGDGDDDGFGNAAITLEACAQPPGHVPNADDCNDAHAGIHPDATEVCDPNNVDENCNELADDEDPGPRIGTAYHPDADLDGFGDQNTPGLVVCDSVPAGLIPDGSDCDDTTELVRPGATETCDGSDQDCDGETDEDATDTVTWYPDADDDGFGATAGSVSACLPPTGHVGNDDDCDDALTHTHPGAEEVCGGLDEDCDGLVDEPGPHLAGGQVYFLDLDGDGHGGSPVQACGPGPGRVATDGDCDDLDLAIHPDAPEQCDSIDHDCDLHLTAGAVDPISWYIDGDGDDYGAGTPVLSCEPVAGRVANDEDCDDLQDSVNPDAVEICGGHDEDCDGLFDDADPSITGQPATFVDTDGDGFGTNPGPALCVPTSGLAIVPHDCNDANANIHPNATEICDPANVDEDCDGEADGGGALGTMPIYADLDQDGFGSTFVVGNACDPGASQSMSSTDCDDMDPGVNPSRQEVCDDSDVDEDCDGHSNNLDPEGALGTLTLYADSDDDGFGDPNFAELRCPDSSAPWVEDHSDCDDADDDVFPGNNELALDGVDSDCDLLDFVCGDSTLLVPTYVPTITAAAAAACSGDAIILAPGVYHESQIDLTGKSVLIDVTDSTNRPVIDGGGSGPILRMDSDIHLDDLIIQNGSASQGGCIEVLDGDHYFEDLELRACTATVAGGAVYIDEGSVYLDEVLVSGGSAPTGAGVFIAPDGDLHAEDATFEYNDTTGRGGAISCDRGALSANYTLFENNGANEGGAVHLDSCSNMDFHDCEFRTNTASLLGGGLAWSGPGISECDGPTFCHVVDTLFEDNVSGGGGGGISVVDSGSGGWDLRDVTFNDNEAGTGGGIYLSNANNTFLEGSILHGNQAIDGAAIFATNVRLNWEEIVATDNVATSNHVVSAYGSTQADVAILDMQLHDNTSAGVGLFVQSDEPLEMVDLEFRNNDSLNIQQVGPAVFRNLLIDGGTGGMLVLNEATETTVVENATFSNVTGTAVEIAIDGTFDLVNSIVADNNIGFNALHGTPDLRYCNVFGNSTDFVGMTAPGGSNLSVDPLFVGGADFHLQSGSPMIDAGSPHILDHDGTRSDIGVYGGPLAP